MNDYFSRLYLKKDASLNDVKKAYRKLAKKFHPDKNSESTEYSEEFKLIHEAYEKLLIHFGEKKAYNAQGYYHQNNEEQASTDIVKSSAKHAKPVNVDMGELIYNGLMTVLIILFFVCAMYGIIDQLNKFF